MILVASKPFRALINLAPANRELQARIVPLWEIRDIIYNAEVDVEEK